MKPSSAAGRLAAMDRDELRFRVVMEARQLAERVRAAVRTPAWRPGALVGALDPGAGPLVRAARHSADRGRCLDAHVALAAHLERRHSQWPLKAAERPTLTQEITRRFPDSGTDARQAADRILDGRIDLLGYRNVATGNPPDWCRDVIHGRRAPLEHWANVPYLDPAIGDHKIIWELNRHQYWLALGRAYWLTNDARYREAFVTQLADWLRANPPLTGINWASMLELAFRTLSWTWCVELFADGADDDRSPWLVDLFVALDRQLTHIERNLSLYFSPNTHLTGEALGLYAVSLAFPELAGSARRAATGRTILLREAERQVLADGGHAERSAHYHRYSTEFYLLALLLARASGDSAAGAFEECARRQARYLRIIADDRGRLPLLGDDDGGMLFCGRTREASDARSTLAIAASALADPSLLIDEPDEDVYWTLGKPPGVALPVKDARRWPSAVLRDSGYVVSRDGRGSHLIFDAGPHGFLNGGHAHADALSIVMTIAGEPLFVDPGTGTYTVDPALRDRFRSSRMHNTLLLDGRDPWIPEGPFHWRTRLDARLLVARTAPECDFAAGTHDGYGAGRHIRALAALHDLGWLVVDRVVTSTPIQAELWWHLHPSWTAAVHDRHVALESASGLRLQLASTAQDVFVTRDPDIASFAPEYGRLEQAAAIGMRHRSSTPFVVATFIPEPAHGDRAATIAEFGESTKDAWRFAEFLVNAAGRKVHVGVAFPLDIQSQPREHDWPQPCISAIGVNERGACVE